MRRIIISVLAGTILGAITATAMLTGAQQPEWYRDTLQGQFQQRMDMQELQFEQDLQRQQPHQYREPWEKPPC